MPSRDLCVSTRRPPIWSPEPIAEAEAEAPCDECHLKRGIGFVEGRWLCLLCGAGAVQLLMREVYD